MPSAVGAIERRIDIYILNSFECVAVGSDGQLWHLATAASNLLSAEGESVVHELRPRVQQTATPRHSRGDSSAPSAAGMISIAHGVDFGGERGTTHVVMFPFAGHWHRVLLTRGSAVATATQAIDCLSSTIADAATAAALREPAAVADPIQSLLDDECRTPEPGVLERWVDGGWHSHSLTPAPIVDPVTGILHQVRRRSNIAPLPMGFVHLHAELPHLQSVDPLFTPDALAPAGALDDGQRSSAELIEPGLLSGVAHYCGTDLGQGEREYASSEAIRHRGERYFDLASWQPHDPALHTQAGFPFSALSPSTGIDWMQGQDAVGPVWVPQSLVYADYLRGSRDSALPTNTNNLVGLQAGRSWAEAVERAAAHVVAHDAVAVWWSSTERASAVPLPHVVRTVFSAASLRVRALAIRSTFGVPVRLAVIDDENENIISLGFAAHANTGEATELAVVEALIQHASAHDLAGENSLIRSSAGLGNGAVAGLAGWLPHRHYAHAFGARHRGLIDPMAHVQFGLDPRVVATTRWRTTPSEPTHGPEQTSAVNSIARAVGSLLTTVDVTTSRAHTAGFRAVRALVPGLARLQPAAFPLGPSARLAHAREQLGWSAAATAEPYPGW
ncbi:thiazole/oxazole-forming peptide maturase SagD family component [Rhodoglobus vestalii]|uniref:Thiazole/oxazole-forming peptide maturase SagD family component n=1 Tax=Rhodoglobus vestalii TaxID=193384 RepID=A0A8H2K9G8_9MICO|nr:YcaO-like family protein [Rhodoglobus vestalii]TQO20126.1 thiazole/oxazole-forming peptide maturase SagD family component [Rhodoglobus vestalii]